MAKKKEIVHIVTMPIMVHIVATNTRALAVPRKILHASLVLGILISKVHHAHLLYNRRTEILVRPKVKVAVKFDAKLT